VARVIVQNEGQRVVVAADPRQVVARQPQQRVGVAVAAGPQGPQGEPGLSGAGFTYTQASPATTWIINHNLGFRPSVEVLSVGGAEIEADVVHVSLNQTRIYFVAPTAGSARLT